MKNLICGSTAAALATACKNVAEHYQTLYVRGCFGAPMTKPNKERYITHHSYNQKEDRRAMIEAASADTFGFDCVCLIKGLLWGWSGGSACGTPIVTLDEEFVEGFDA